MKHILLSLALPVLLAAGLAPRADARDYYGGSRTWISSYSHCGCPVYSQRYVAHRDCWGRPVYRVRTLQVSHRCHARTVRSSHGGCNTGARYGRGYSQNRYQHSGFRSNRHLHRAIPVPRLPQIIFGRGRSVHGSCR